MSGQGNGNGTGNGNGMENGNGIGEKAWNLAQDGMLWKTVLTYASKIFREQAQTLVAQLQESVQPADALQGLLLDRIAAGYLRKQLFLELEAARLERKMAAARDSRRSAETNTFVANSVASDIWFKFGEVIRYEAFLDQTLHRDLILLQQLKKAAAAARVVSAQTSPESNRGLIEGEVEHPDVG